MTDVADTSMDDDFSSGDDEYDDEIDTGSGGGGGGNGQRTNDSDDDSDDEKKNGSMGVVRVLDAVTCLNAEAVWLTVDNMLSNLGGAAWAIVGVDSKGDFRGGVVRNANGEDVYPMITKAFDASERLLAKQAENVKELTAACLHLSWADVLRKTNEIMLDAIKQGTFNNLRAVPIPRINIPFPFRCSNMSNVFTFDLDFTLPARLSKPSALAEHLKKLPLVMHIQGDAFRARYAKAIAPLPGHYHFLPVGVRLRNSVTTGMPLDVRIRLKTMSTPRENGTKVPQYWTGYGSISDSPANVIGWKILANTPPAQTLRNDTMWMADAAHLIDEKFQKWKCFDIQAMEDLLTSWRNKGANDSFLYVPVVSEVVTQVDHALVHLFMNAAPQVIQRIRCNEEKDPRLAEIGPNNMITHNANGTFLRFPGETADALMRELRKLMGHYDTCMCIDDGFFLEFSPDGPTGNYSSFIQYVEGQRAAGVPEYEMNLPMNLSFTLSVDVIPIRASPWAGEPQLPVELGQLSPAVDDHLKRTKVRRHASLI